MRGVKGKYIAIPGSIILTAVGVWLVARISHYEGGILQLVVWPAIFLAVAFGVMTIKDHKRNDRT